MALQYVDTAVEDNFLYCYNSNSDRNSVVSHVSYRMDVTDAFHIVGSRLWTLRGITLKVYEYVRVRYFFKLIVRVVIFYKQSTHLAQCCHLVFFSQNPHYSYIKEHLTRSTSICIFPCFFMIYQS